MNLDFRALFESVPGLFLVLLPDAPRYTIVAASDAYLAATMTTREQLLGRGIFEAFPENPADPTAKGERNLRASLDGVRAHRSVQTMALQKWDILRPESEGGGYEMRYWSPLNAPVLHADGSLLHIIHRVEDVTELVRLAQRYGDPNLAMGNQGDPPVPAVEVEAQILRGVRQIHDTNHQLRAANEQLAEMVEAQVRALFDLMPQLGWTAKPDGHIHFYNRGWYEYTGYTFEEMEGWGWQRVHDPEMLPLVVAQWQKSLDTGTPFEMEFPLRRHDGVFRWFLTRIKPIRNAHGVMQRWVGINTDIHDRRQAASQSEDQLRLLVESVRDAIFMLDANGKITTWNQAAERMSGYRAGEVIGKPLTLFFSEEDLREGRFSRELEVATDKGRFEGEGWRVRKDGLRFWASVVVSALRDEVGELVGFAKVMHDLSDRRAAEEERRQLIRAEEAIKLRDEFLSIASHELKTPLTSLQLGIESIAKRVSSADPRLARIIDRTIGSASRLTTLVETLLDVSRISAGHLTLQPERFDLGAAVSEMSEALADAARDADCEVSVRASVPVVGNWDRMRLEQVVANLLGNAFKYAAGHSVEVTVTLAGDRASLMVTDHGPGIAAEDLARIFLRFERAAPSNHFGGLGLGLYITRQIVEAHHGSIAVHSTLGQGSTFVVDLPLDATQATGKRKPAIGGTRQEKSGEE